MGLTKPRAAQIFNLDYKQSTRVVTTTNITLTGGTPSSVDSVNLSTGDRVLVTGQTTGTQNGLYYVVTVGSGVTGTWARTSDGNENGEIEAGMIVMVTEGTIYADTQWKLITDDPITINTTALTFTQNYMANSIAGGSSNVTVYSNANVVISSAGTANVLTVTSTGTVVTGTESVTGNILTGGLISATGNITGNYFLGNVFYANGITASKIYNGTSEANVGTSGGNANISIGGTSNVVVFASTGEYVSGLLSVTGNITGGNIAATSANISTFIGNTFFGSVPAQPTYYNIAPLNLNNSLAAATKVQLNLINTGGGAGAGSAIDFYTYQISVAAANAESRIAAIDDGNYSAYLSLQTKTPGSTGTNGLVERVKIDSTGASVVANVTGGNIRTGGQVSATANVTGGNILTGGIMSSTGNVTGGNVSATLISGTTLSATGNVIGGNITTGGLVSATGNVTGNYILGNVFYASGITASKIYNGTSEVNVGTSGGNANISIGGTSNVAVFSNTGAYFNGNLVPATSNVYSLGSATNRWANLWLTGNTIYLGNAVITSADSGDIIIDSSGSFAVPVGTTAERSEIRGSIRYNTTVGAFETFDGAGWNTLAYGTQTDFPFGDYGSVSDAATTDAFGVSIAATFDCNAEGPFSYTDLADGEAYVGA
jgi:hypothetical protein